MASSFQNLPEIIIGNILAHATGLSRNDRSFASRQQACTASDAIAFISTCHSWRSVARPVIFQLAYFSDTDHTRRYLLSPLRINIRSAVSLGVKHLVLSALFDLSASSGPSCNSIVLLSHDILSNACFPATMALTLVYAATRKTKQTSLYSTQCIRRLACLFPHLAITSIVVDGHCESLPAVGSNHTRRSAHSQLARDIPLSLALDSGLASQLTQLDWKAPPKASTLTLLALLYRNRSTLESLSLHDSNPQTWLQAVQSEDGQSIVYPQLTSLVVDGEVSWFQTPRQSPVGVPFPALRSVKCLNSYPFANDIVFRGNATHLVHISLQVDPGSLQLLNNIGVVSHGRFPNAVKLRISSQIYCCPDDLARSIYANALAVAPKAQYVRLDIVCPREMDGSRIVPDIAAVGSSRVQVLALPRVTFNVSDVVSLASSCPSLARLTVTVAKHNRNDAARPISPAHTRLTELHICNVTGWASSEMSHFATTFKQYLPKVRRISFGNMAMTPEI